MSFLQVRSIQMVCSISLLSLRLIGERVFELDSSNQRRMSNTQHAKYVLTPYLAEAMCADCKKVVKFSPSPNLCCENWVHKIDLPFLSFAFSLLHLQLLIVSGRMIKR